MHMRKVQIVCAAISVLLCLFVIALKTRLIKVDPNDNVGRFVRGEPANTSHVGYRNPQIQVQQIPTWQENTPMPTRPRFNTSMGP